MVIMLEKESASEFISEPAEMFLSIPEHGGSEQDSGKSAKKSFLRAKHLIF